MKRNDETRARRAQVALFADALAAAVDRRDAIVRRLLDESGGEPVTPPPLELDGLTRDALDTVLDGLRGALAGERDPFGIAAPRGRSPALERQQAIAAVAAVLELRDLGEPVGAAIAAIANRYHVADDTLREQYEDADVREWAEIQRRAY